MCLKIEEWWSTCNQLAQILAPDDSVLTHWRERVKRIRVCMPVLHQLASKTLQVSQTSQASLLISHSFHWLPTHTCIHVHVHVYGYTCTCMYICLNTTYACPLVFLKRLTERDQLVYMYVHVHVHVYTCITCRCSTYMYMYISCYIVLSIIERLSLFQRQTVTLNFLSIMKVILRVSGSSCVLSH